MEHDFSLSNPLLDLDQPKLHPRSQLDQPNRTLLALDSSSPVAPPNIITRKPNLAPPLILLAPTRMPTLAPSLAHITHLGITRHEPHPLVPQDIITDILRATEVQHPLPARTDAASAHTLVLRADGSAAFALAGEGKRSSFVGGGAEDDFADRARDADGSDGDEIVTEVDCVGLGVVG